MTTLSLKSYQQAALDALARVARSAQMYGAAQAFREQAGHSSRHIYNGDAFGAVSCVCLRIPTGGGKTLLAAHAIQVMAQEQGQLWRTTDAPAAGVIIAEMATNFIAITASSELQAAN